VLASLITAISGTAHFEAYCDPSFLPPGASIPVVPFEDPASKEQARQRGVIDK